MADGLSFELKGAGELRARLKLLSDDMRFKGGRFALRKAANVLREQVKSNANRLDDPATVRRIADNVAIRWSGRTFRRTGNLKFRVGIMGGANDGKKGTGPGGDTYYWRFLEFGTERQRPKPFMRPAMMQAMPRIADEFIRQYNRALDRALKRAALKKAR